MSKPTPIEWTARGERELRARLAILETRQFLAESMRDRFVVVAPTICAAIVVLIQPLSHFSGPGFDFSIMNQSGGLIWFAQIFVIVAFLCMAILFVIGRLRLIQSKGELLRLKLEFFTSEQESEVASTHSHPL